MKKHEKEIVMKILKQNVDILTLPDNISQKNIVCVTTNGTLRKNGNGIMGKGIALYFHKLFNLETILGECLRAYGNVPSNLGSFEYRNHKFDIVSFPTKQDWRNPSDVNLIKESAERLKQLTDTLGYEHVYLPPVGCGCGGLDINDVINVLQPILNDERFVMIIPVRSGK